ncbi:YihY/virulence factor BrkB family protein [Herbidospora mongoliensis]|uniref:YihY/virulence factor BrkB family protein n=1 Tax=Herbidospora mongoliensis TaxID=688067 RepID=UPI000AF3F991|nr:YihY/virulence factor BrkB family protein [Herbidospora mongoliensis]
MIKRALQSFLRFIDVVKAWGRAKTESARIRFRWVDHLIRTIHRYQVLHGDRLAGAVTYFAFLSFFPIIALSFAVFGYVVTFRPDALQTLNQAINDQLPGLADKLDLSYLAEARSAATIIGLIGLLYSGLGAVDTLRTALRDMWMSRRPAVNFFVGKGYDLVALVLIGLAMILSVVVSAAASGATSTVAGWLGFGASWLVSAGLVVVGIVAALAADTLVFLVMFWWLARPAQPFKIVLRGSLVGAVLFGVLKQSATLLLSHTLSNNTLYGAFTVMIGLLLWINLSARVIFYSAAWTATATLGPPPEPSPAPATHDGYDEAVGD